VVTKNILELKLEKNVVKKQKGRKEVTVKQNVEV